MEGFARKEAKWYNILIISLTHTSMNITALTQLVQTTPVLSQEERAYWLTHLSKLNKEQREELASTLQPSGALPFEKELTSYFDAIGQAADEALRTSAKTAA
jgi:hypothetical protein